MESPHVCHSANCGEFQTTRPRLQVPSFKASLFKSSCHNFSKNSLLHPVNQGQRKVYTIDSNMNKCHWHSPMRKQLRRALGMLKAICQPFPSTTWMHQKYICEQDIFVSKIYLWTKYIYEQNISLGNIYEQNISMSKIYLWAIYIYNINMNHDF